MRIEVEEMRELQEVIKEVTHFVITALTDKRLQQSRDDNLIKDQFEKAMGNINLENMPVDMLLFKIHI